MGSGYNKAGYFDLLQACHRRFILLIGTRDSELSEGSVPVAN